MSALSCLKSVRYSALEVNILYGSSVPFVIRSSINTPIYASLLVRISGSVENTLDTALIPAINPCAAASSYPVVPFICPAKNRFSTSFVSNVRVSCVGGK